MRDFRHALAVVAGFSVVAGAGCGSSRDSARPDGGPSDADAAAPTGAGGAGGAGPAGVGGQSATGGRSGTGGQSGGGGRSGTGGLTGTGGALTPADAGVDANRGTGGVVTDGGRGDGADAANPDGAAAFAACPTNGTPCAILPLGDSITDGFPFENGGYRVELFHQALLAARRVTFVGSLANGPLTVDTIAFPRNHEGHTAFTIVNEPSVSRMGISPLITDTAIATYRPHIILLLIGTNDVDISVDLATAPTRLATLVDEIVTDAPNALLVVGQLTPTATDAENVRFQAYNAAIPGIVQQRAAAGKHVILADMYGAFTANANYKTAYMNDNLHPNPAGYAVMGQTWFAAIRSYLPAGP